MATVFEYIILNSQRKDYRASGTSHEDAMRAFTSDPVITQGFHEGSYDTDDGEEFIVIGPTPDEPKGNVIQRLVAQRRISFIFRTPEQIEAEKKIRDHARAWLMKQIPDQLVEVKASDGSIPPHNKIAPAGEIVSTDFRGLWINGKRIPWSAISDIALADAS